jgi:hypothetical protein
VFVCFITRTKYLTTLRENRFMYVGHSSGTSRTRYQDQLESGEDLMVDGVAMAGFGACTRDHIVRQEVRAGVP